MPLDGYDRADGSGGRCSGPSRKCALVAAAPRHGHPGYRQEALSPQAGTGRAAAALAATFAPPGATGGDDAIGGRLAGKSGGGFPETGPQSALGSVGAFGGDALD